MDQIRAFSILATVLLVVLFSIRTGFAKPDHDSSLHIHMISGSNEYKSAKSLPAWKKRLESQYDVNCTMSMGQDNAKKIDGLEHLKQADLLVLFNRRFHLKETYWKPIENYLKSGRPVLGIRTASHAFDTNFPKIDVKLLGADYHGHEGEEAVQVSLAEEAESHPILSGISSWKRHGKLYNNKNFAPTTTVLLKGKGKNAVEPVAWINELNNQRIFYTSMGFPHDFENSNFLRLLKNAVEWTTRTKLTGKNKK